MHRSFNPLITITSQIVWVKVFESMLSCTPFTKTNDPHLSFLLSKSPYNKKILTAQNSTKFLANFPKEKRLECTICFQVLLLINWSGRWESDPPLKLGKLAYYRCTTPAWLQSTDCIFLFLQIWWCDNWPQNCV